MEGPLLGAALLFWLLSEFLEAAPRAELGMRSQRLELARQRDELLPDFLKRRACRKPKQP